MGLTVAKRVHVMPVGFEYDRVIEPAKDYSADLVVLVGHKHDNQTGEECWERIINGLEEENIEYQTRWCDIFNLYESLATIAEVIASHQEDDVYVNVSSGSKITAIAGMIASMVMDSRAYYAKAAKYDGLPEGIDRVSELPKYPIDAPDRDQIKVMEFLESWAGRHGPPTKGEIIHFSEKAGLDYTKTEVAGKGKYRLLDTHVLEPLKSRDWVTEAKQGRNKVVHLTQDGEAALSAFRWLEGNGVDIQTIIDEIEENQQEEE